MVIAKPVLPVLGSLDPSVNAGVNYWYVVRSLSSTTPAILQIPFKCLGFVEKNVSTDTEGNSHGGDSHVTLLTWQKHRCGWIFVSRLALEIGPMVQCLLPTSPSRADTGLVLKAPQQSLRAWKLPASGKKIPLTQIQNSHNQALVSSELYKYFSLQTCWISILTLLDIITFTIFFYLVTILWIWSFLVKLSPNHTPKTQLFNLL